MGDISKAKWTDEFKLSNINWFKMKKYAFILAVLYTSCFYLNAGSPLVLLHTNDVHSQLEPLGSNDLKNAGKGGIVRRIALVNQIKKTEPNVLVFESGDFVQGTSYFNVYSGQAEIKLMNCLGLDAVTLGNHEFDNGVDFLAKMLKWSKFKVVCTNYDASKTVLKKFIHPWLIVRKGPIRIGIVSANIAPFGLISTENFRGIQYLDPIKVTDSTATWLKVVKKCDIVVCLSHLGYDREGNTIDDLMLASKSKNIDVILGGHSHTFMKEPALKENAKGGMVIINQSGKGGVMVGRIDLDIIQTAKKRQ